MSASYRRPRCWMWRLSVGSDDGYLERLGGLYERWIEDYGLSRVVVVPGDDLDFVNDDASLRKLLDLLERNGLTAPVVV